MPIMVCRLTKEFSFEAAHKLPYVATDHPCGQLHGHSYRVEIAVEGEVDPKLGWVYDLSQISEAMNPIVSQLDHHYLNEIAGLENPTVEMLCAWLWERLAPLCPGLCEIVIWETARARCSYRGK
jgi:6-pyruvoyltetrahydropterin/6-carboxytetrahydropterin synthase